MLQVVLHNPEIAAEDNISSVPREHDVNCG
jgi:hypothetical protein